MQLTVFQSESGLPSLRRGPEPLEDPVDPMAGAAAFVRPEVLASARHVVLFGAGLGYRARRLAELGRTPIVYEPEPDALRLAREHGPGLPADAPVLTDLRALRLHLLEVTGSDDTTILLVAPPYQRAYPSEVEAVRGLVDEVQGFVRIKRNSVSERASLLVERALENLPRLARVPSIDQVGAPLAGTPAFLVAAGPSLDRNRHLLKAASAKGAIFAVNTSAPVLAAIDTPIDVLVSIEALDVSEPIRLAAPITRALALDLTSGGPSYDIDVFRKLAFTIDAPQLVGLSDALGLGTLRYGASVATTAFALAAALGADPIVLVGQDLAYPEGRGYASDTLFETTRVTRDGRFLVFERAAKWDEMTRAGGLKVPAKVRPAMEVPAWGGGTVDTTHELSLFRQWFEEAARLLKGRRRMINATEGGAHIEGFEELPLEAVLRELPARTDRLHEAIAAAAPTPVARLRRAARDVERASRALAKHAERCEASIGKPRLARAVERLREAAREAPLAEAHSAPGLLELREDEAPSPLERERRTYAIIRRSAARVAELAKKAAAALPDDAAARPADAFV